MSDVVNPRRLLVQKLQPGPLALAALVLAILLAGQLTVLLKRTSHEFTPVGLIDALVLAMLLATRRASWPAVLMAAAVGEVAFGIIAGNPLHLVLAMTSVSLVVCSLSALLFLRTPGPSADMAHLPNLARYLAGAAVVAILGACLASAVRWAVAGSPMWPNLLLWASREFVGVATLTPCFLILASRLDELKSLAGPRAWPLGLLAVVEAATFFTDRTPLTYLLVAALLLVTWRLRMAGGAVGILMTFAFGVPATALGHGPFAAFPVSVTERLLALQFFLTVAFHITVPVAAQLARAHRLREDLGQALTAARQSEAMHRMIAENSQDIIAQVDRQGRVAYVSPAVRTLGYRPEDLIGRRAEDLIHPDDAVRFLNNTGLVLRGMPVPGNDHRFRARHKDGGYRWLEGSPARLIDEKGESYGLVSVLRDIHDQRAIHEALAASEARYRLLANNMNDIVACYGRDGIITYASGATTEILGREPQELIGVDIVDWLHPDDIEPSREAFQRHREAGPGAPPFRVEYRMRRRDGSWVWLQANPRGVFDAEGGFVEWQDVVRDVSASKALEDELRSARAKADAAARLTAEFLADMGHEVRGPLNSVLGFTRIARAQKDRVDWCMSCIEQAAGSLLTMVGDILDFSRLEAAQVQFRTEPVRLSELLAAALAQLEPQARAKGLELRLVDDTGDRVVATDGNRVRQVLLNLLGNAVKFTHAGNVALEATYDEARGRLCVQVRDTGPGVAADQLGDIFERFSPAQPSGGRAGGVGLGLAISKGIVEGLGGEIQAASEPGQGSVFSLWLPAPVVDEADRNTPDERSAVALRILVAAGEPALHELVARSLARRGQVLPADDLAAATRLAAAEPVDLIIVDLTLARGPATLRRLRKASGPNSRTPALAFSHDTSDEAIARALGQGFQGLIARNSSPPELVSAVAEALLAAEWSTHGRGVTRVAGEAGWRRAGSAH